MTVAARDTAGDRAPIATLLEGRERFLAFVRSKVGDPELAEDVLQEGLLKALRAAPEIRDEERLVAWFYRVLQNAVVDTYRRRGVERGRLTGLQGVDVEAEPGEADAADEAALCECLRELVPVLRPEYGELIRALDLEGEAPEAAAARLGITANNLKVRRHRARQALRRRLEETCWVCAEHHCLDCVCRRDGTEGTDGTDGAVDAVATATEV